MRFKSDVGSSPPPFKRVVMCTAHWAGILEEEKMFIKDKRTSLKSNLVIILLLLSSTFAFSYSFEDKYNCSILYRAIDNNINIRTEPNLTCKTLGQLFFNDRIYVDIERSTSEWFYCYIPKIDNIAYCSTKYFVIVPDFTEDLRKKYYDGDETVISDFKNKYIKPVVFDYIIENELSKFSEEKCLSIVKNIYESKNFKEGDSTILTSATRTNYYSVVQYLVSKEDILENINRKNNQYAPAIFWAIQNGNVKITELLLKNGADPNVRTVYGYTMKEHIDSYYVEGRISRNTANELIELLNKYNYKETDYLKRFISSPFLEIEKFPDRFFRESEIQKYKDIGYSIEIDEDNHIIKIRNERIEVTYCYSNSQREYYMVFLSIIPIEEDFMKNNIHVGISEKSIRSYFGEELFTFSKDVNNYVLSSHKKEDKGNKVFFQFSNNGLERITFVYYTWAKYINYNYESLQYY